MPTPDAGMPGPSNGKSTADAVQAANKQLLTMENITKRIAKLTGEIKKNLGGQTANAMGGMSNSEEQTSGMLSRLQGLGGGALRVGAFGFGMGMGMMPNVQTAVSQRIMAQGMGSMTGNTPQEIIAMSNRLLGNGFTSSQGGVQSAGSLAAMGIMPGSVGFQNIMGNVGGLSVLTQQSNQDVAAQYASINSMGFMRAGVMARDSQGNLRSPSDIANDVYKRIYGNKQLTKDQAATLLNPNSKGFQSLLSMTGGNADLSRTIATQMYFQGLNGGNKVDASSAQNIMDNVLHLQKDDPLRKFYSNQGSEASKLGVTGDSLVKGYGAALDAVTATNKGFIQLSQVLPGVVDAMGRIAGFGATLPTVGNTGATLAGAGSQVANVATNSIGGIMAGRALSKLEGKGAAGAAGAAGRMGAGSIARIAGAATIVAAGGAGVNYLRTHGGAERHSKKDMLGTAAAWAGTGALAGSILPGVGTGIGALLGGAAGLAYGAYEGVYGGDTGSGSVKTSGNGSGSGNGNAAFHMPSDKPRGVPYGAKPHHPGQWTWKGYHTGQDFLDPPGTPVYSIRDGVVINAKMNANGPAYGNSILIDHGPFQSLYAHLSKIMVKAGAKVKAGQIIGLSGETGTGARGPHLHFEIRKDGNPVNPAKYLSGGAMPKESTFSKVKHKLGVGVHNHNPGADQGDEGEGSQFMSTTVSESMGSMFSLSSKGLGTTGEATTAGIGGDVGSGSVKSVGSSLGRGSINVHLNVNIASASNSDVVRMAEQIKKILENELNISKIGNY